MRLSEAMLLGSTTCKMVPGDWNSCALGCAGNAVGLAPGVKAKGEDRAKLIHAVWPWLADSPNLMSSGEEIVGLIWQQFDYDVCGGTMTLEQLVDYVRSIEPDCGECNQFQCSCPQTAAVTEDEAVLINS